MTGHRDFTPEELGQPATYHLLNAVIAPRPIAWISTVSASGTFNLAPHSYTTVVSQDPPIVSFVSIGRKDSVRNEATGCFVYNVGSHQMVERINRTLADFPPDVSEFEWAGQLDPGHPDRCSTRQGGAGPDGDDAGRDSSRR